ncbi:MAG: SirB1 family protein [Phycisphaerae bacterium]
MVIHPFDQLMELEAPEIRLDCAALHLARDVYPELNLFSYLSRLDAFAADVLAARPKHTAVARYLAMREVLIEQHKLCGNGDDYYDPQNSYLNRVLDRRKGIPLSLGVVWIEVARRLEWPVQGVSFPGHFLLRFDDLNQTILVDPFFEGRSLDRDDCQKLLDRQFDGKIKLSDDLLEPADNRAILTRMLQNLRAVYSGGGDRVRLVTVLKRLLAIDPSNINLRQELADLRGKVDLWWDGPQDEEALISRDDASKVGDVVITRVDAAKAKLN